MKIPFIDLQAQRTRISCSVDAALARVLAHGQFILGPEVTEFERTLAAFEGSKHALGCANGTDALVLVLRAWGIGAGDAVFCPSFTYTATAEAIVLAGAQPVFVDIDRSSYNMCANSLRAAIDGITSNGDLRPRAVIAVDLFGTMADYYALRPICDKNGLKLISDCAQAIGCRRDGKSAASQADATTASFFPAKPLGCYGDGGAVLCNDDALIHRLRSLAFHGRSATPNDHEFIGMNSRLDTMQAAILLEKLVVFKDELQAREAIAKRYNYLLQDHVLQTPIVPENGVSAWAQYTMEVRDRDRFMTSMKDKGIPVAAYYPRPIHKQTAYLDYPAGAGGLANTEDASRTTVSLPMHPYLDEKTQDMIVDAAISIFKENG